MGILQPGAGSSQPIDQLSYSYYSNSNQLQNVIDASNNPNTTLGDFRTSSLSPYATGKTASAVDYKYDVNGNLTRDLNKDIGSATADGIIYNHLNLPWQITFRSATGTKGTITYIYDATGNKLKKTTNDSAGNLQTVTTYIGAFQYQGRQALGSGTPADTLQFLGQEEGRVRLKTDTTGGQSVSSWKYDYFLKDHLGNTRMVLTDEQETDQYPAATMEVGDSSLENLYYTNLDETRAALPPGYPTDTTTKPNQSVAELYSADGNPVIGPGIVLKVMAGDQFSVKTSNWYQNSGTTPGQVPNPASDLVSALIAGVAHIPGEGATAGAMSSSPTLTPNMLNFLADTGVHTINEIRPHAFLNWILFDNQFNYVSASSGYQQVGASGTLNQMILTNLPVTSSGFLYIYVSNTTPNVPVFFDNLQVTHIRGPLLEEDHYYPFGLLMGGISDKAIKSNYAENKYRGNDGDELQNKEFSDGSGLEEYDAFFRMYDPQIGRFGSIDPLADVFEGYSPYSFADDNPIGYNDPLGLAGKDTGTAKLNLDPVVVTPPKTPPKTQVNSDLALIGTPPGGIDLPSAPTTAPDIPLPGGEPVGEPTPGPDPAPPPALGPAAFLTAVFVAIPITGNTDWPGGHEFPQPFVTAPGPYTGHGNKKENWNPHIVYQFTFTPPTGDPKTPVLKYGISDEYRFGLDRPESQLAGLRAKYGPTVMYSIYTRTISRQMALFIEADLVKQHKDMWNGALPREQLKPNP